MTVQPSSIYSSSSCHAFTFVSTGTKICKSYISRRNHCNKNCKRRVPERVPVISSESSLAIHTVKQLQSQQDEQEIIHLKQRMTRSQEQMEPGMPIPLQDVVHKFDSYARNIIRTRRPYNSNTNHSSHNNSQNSSSSISNSNSHETIQIVKQMNHSTSPLLSSQKQRQQPQQREPKQNHQPQRQEIINYNPNTCMVAIRSFLYTLQKESQAWADHHIIENNNDDDVHAVHATTITNAQAEQLKHGINTAIIHAIRASADYGDYNMIIKIVHAAVDYATQVKVKVKAPSLQLQILEPRIFGEAITELKRTKVSTSKIKKVWKQFITLGALTIQQQQSDLDSQNVLSSPPSAYELNAMLLALASRGKVRAALSLYYGHVLDNKWNDSHNSEDDVDDEDDDGDIAAEHQADDHFLHIDGDEYTTSTIMTILAESIASDETTVAIPQQTDEQNQIINLNKNKQQIPSPHISPCWQWREAESILDILEQRNQKATTKPSTTMLNNHVYSMVLKVNEEASELYKYPGNRHYGSTTAMAVLERMKRQHVSPDVVTCSAVMAAFDKGMQWKAALALLKSMERSISRVKDSSDKVSSNYGDDIGIGKHSPWELPPPNEYTYASAMSACARSGQFDEAVEILDRLRESGGGISSSKGKAHKVSPNIWMYNSALAACMPTKSQYKLNQVQNQKRSKTAMKILRRMEEDATKGMDTIPDTVSYNTIIAAIGSLILFEPDDTTSGFGHEFICVDDRQGAATELETNVMLILEKMKENSVHRDPITYRNAMLTCQADVQASLRILDMALDDLNSFTSGAISKWGSLTKIKSYLINIALSVCASKGDMVLVKKLFDYMRIHNIQADSRSMNHLIIALSTAGDCDNSMWVLNAMKGDGAANAMFLERYKINIMESGKFADFPMIEEYHYSSAITCCLRQGQLFPALKILNGMKVHGLTPNESNLHGIIVAYCKLATEKSSYEFKEAKIEQTNKNRKGLILPVRHEASRTRATAALAMLNSMKEAPFRLQSIVASACAASGMWIEAREILWSIHIAAVKERYRDHSAELVVQSQGSALGELPKLHTSLLKLCARSGNVTAALWYADAIQDLSSKFERKKKRNGSNSSVILSQFDNGDSTTDNSISIENVSSSSKPKNKNIMKKYGIGMGSEEWKLVNIAASKSCHWKVCLGVLQFVQPYVEATHPRHAATGDDHNSSLTKLNEEYESLARILSDSILSFEARSQYAWAVRAIDDWITWSGRRPRREAIFATCRILANRGLGNQVTLLVTNVLNVPSHDMDMNAEGMEEDERVDGIPSYEASYERAVYTEAITSLFKHGLYDNADELYAKAASQGYLPWAVVNKKSPSSSRLQLDLHGMNKAIAHSAVRVSLQHIVQSNGIIENDVMIVTGRGTRSSQHLRPVLRPEVQRMLMEEFYPPLGTSSVPGNMGALRISSDDVKAWLKHQQQQRGARFLAMADVLKTLTSGERLKQLLKKKMNGNETPRSQ